MSSTTLTLAEWAANLEYNDIPEKVITHVKKCILDNIGCVAFGTTTPWGSIIVDMVKEWGGKEESTVWGTNVKVPTPNSALANGTLGHSFELDDVHSLSGVHPASLVATPSLGAAEMVGDIDGKTFLTAVVAGYEIAIRLALAIPHHRLYTSGMFGPFGSATGVGKIIGLNTEQMASAFHLAGTQSAGLYTLYSACKRFNIGKAAQSGVLAALMAKKGFQGTSDILEREHGGFCISFADEYHLDMMTEKLGKYFHAGDSGLKLYSCGRGATAVVGAIREVMDVNPEVIANNIEKVTIILSERIYHGYMPWWHEVTDQSSAITSMPYCSAVMIMEGDALIDQFSNDKIRDPKIWELAKKVEVTANPEFDKEYKYTVAVEIELKDGEKIYNKIHQPKGDPLNPVSKAEIEHKFTRVASKVLSDEKVKEIIKTVNKLEQIDNMTKLAEIISQ